MKKLMIALSFVAAFATSPAMAERATQADIDRTCAAMSGLARKIMEARQSGAEMSAMLVAADGNEMARAMVMDAYSESLFQTESIRNRVIDEFANSTHLTCIKVFTNSQR